MAKIQEVLKDNAKKILNKTIPGNSPDFIIAGAQKAGTSSLFSYLNQHPQLFGARQKEINFFDLDENYSKGKQWYLNFFRSYSRPFRTGLYFEATPEYLYNDIAAERIYEFDSSMKIIILLREPVKRAFSAWNMFRDFTQAKHGNPPKYLSFDKNSQLFKELYSTKFPSFEEAVEREIKKIEIQSETHEPSFLRRGIYLPKIKKYHHLFGKEKVLVLGFKDLIQKKKETLNEVLSFLDIKKSDWSFLDDEIRNSRKYTHTIHQDIEIKLREFYEPHNEALFDYLGKTPNW